MKQRTNLRMILIFCIMVLAILLIGSTKVNATNEELKYCVFTINSRNDDNSFNMGQGDEESQELGCELENIKGGYYLKLNTQINLGQYIELNGLGGFRLERTYKNTNDTEDTSTYYEYKTDIKSIADITKSEEQLKYDLKDINTNTIQHFTLDLFFRGDLTSIKKEKQELEQKSNTLNLPKADKDLAVKYVIAREVELEDNCTWIEDCYSYEELVDYTGKTLQNAFQESSIKVILSPSNGGSGGFGVKPFYYVKEPWTYCVFKDDIFYGNITVGAYVKFKITVPSNNSNIEDYATTKIKAYFNRYNNRFKNEELGEFWDAQFIKLTKVNGDDYKINWCENPYMESDIVIKKATSDNTGNTGTTETKPITKEDKTTGIKIEAQVGSISANITISSNKVTDQATINKVAEVLKNISNKYVTYDISLLENGTKVQPNGKIKVSIPIPSGYDTSKLVVYRVTESGEKIEYKPTISGNYATIETDHFSTYVLAETGTVKAPNQDKPNTSTSNSNKLDKTPKTGVNNVILVSSAIVSIISLAGIIIIKKK